MAGQMQGADSPVGSLGSFNGMMGANPYKDFMNSPVMSQLTGLIGSFKGPPGQQADLGTPDAATVPTQPGADQQNALDRIAWLRAFGVQG